MGNSSKRDTRRAETAEKHQKALVLRRDGLSLDQIAEKVGVDRVTVWRWIRAAIAAIPEEEANAVRAVELERLDRDWRATQKVLEAIEKRLTMPGPKPNIAADLAHMLRSRRAIQDIRAKYLGLYAPPPVVPTAFTPDAGSLRQAPIIQIILATEPNPPDEQPAPAQPDGAAGPEQVPGADPGLPGTPAG